MALCVCKCLNVTLDAEKTEPNVNLGELLTSSEQRDIFFSEKFVVCHESDLKITVAQTTMIGHRVVGRWTLHSCLACDLITHAAMQDRFHTVLINKSLMTTTEQVQNLRKSTNYSPVFNLLVPEVTSDVDMKENIDSNKLFSENSTWLPVQQAVSSLNKQLFQKLQLQLNVVEEIVQQFKDQKYAEFEAYKERAQREHQILASIAIKARANLDNDGWRMDTGLDNGPPSPQLPPLQRRRLSSIKDAKKIKHAFKSHRHPSAEEDSLDAEDIFDLEGADDSHHDMGSDQEDYDSDNSGSRDEGIHIVRGRGGGGSMQADIARSLPVTMPRFPEDRPHHEDLDDDEEPHDIAASIKALAKSVHGDVFELPRPRFSTQI